jgi:response regulator of citrate/malate metabolism
VTGQPIRVLVVEDEPLLAEAHREYVGRVPGFSTVAVAHNGRDALRELGRQPVDLVLLDFYLPDMSGLDVCQAMRATGVAADVIAVTSARDVDTVRAAISQGVVQYLLKPFTFAALRDKLHAYAEYRAALGQGSSARDQAVVDRALAMLHGSPQTALPKGLSQQTLALLVEALAARTEPASASDLAAATGVSRVTARRYLEHLVAHGAAEQSLRYAKAGRPEILYSPRSQVGGRPAPGRES